MRQYRRKLTTQHWSAAVVFLGAIGGQLMTHKEWSHVVTPTNLGFIFIQGGAFLGALFANSSDDRSGRVDTPRRFDLPDAS